MEAPLHQSPVPLPPAPPQFQEDEQAAVIGAALLRQASAARAMMAAAVAQQQQQQQQALPPPPPAMMGREQCPRCASRDTKFCYYNNYNTAQPRHFCRACRRYWTLGGSLRNVPVGGSTRKRPRPARPTRALAAAAAASAGAPFATVSSSSFPVAPPAAASSLAPPSSSQAAAAALQAGGLLGSLLLGSASASTLLALGAAPLLEGRLGFGPGLGQPALLDGANAAAGDLDGLGFGGAGPLLWPAAATVLEGDRAFPLPCSPPAPLWQHQELAAVEADGLHHGGGSQRLLPVTLRTFDEP